MFFNTKITIVFVCDGVGDSSLLFKSEYSPKLDSRSRYSSMSERKPKRYHHRRQLSTPSSRTNQYQPFIISTNQRSGIKLIVVQLNSCLIVVMPTTNISPLPPPSHSQQPSAHRKLNPPNRLISSNHKNKNKCQFL